MLPTPIILLHLRKLFKIKKPLRGILFYVSVYQETLYLERNHFLFHFRSRYVAYSVGLVFSHQPRHSVVHTIESHKSLFCIMSRSSEISSKKFSGKNNRCVC